MLASSRKVYMQQKILKMKNKTKLL